MQHVVLINPHRPRLQRITHTQRGIEVGSMHGGGEPVGGGVSETDGILFGLEFRDRADGAEDLFLHYFHVFAYVAEDGGLDEVAFFAVALAAGLDLRAFFSAGVDVAGWVVRMWVAWGER